MELNTWTEVLLRSFQDLWYQIALLLPNVLAALVILIVGWAIGKTLGKVVSGLIGALKIDDVLARLGVQSFVERSGYRLSAGGFLGALVKWFIFAVFLVAALDVMKLHQVSFFLTDVVLRFLPQVFVAVLILMVAAVLSEVVQNFVTGAAKSANVTSAEFLGTVARTAIWVFAFFAALNQLGVAQEFLQILFTGIVVALSLATGLAFGLGGRDTAAKIVASAHESLTARK